MPTERLILIIDDDSTLRATLSEQLAADNEFHPVTAASLSEANLSLGSRSVRFDTVLLDLGLPDGDGREYCASLRRQGHKMPIIMLTGSGGEMDIVRSLEAGANDYIVKPFRLQELMARIRAQVRGFETSDHAVFTIGSYLFRPSARSLVERAGNRRVRLTSKEVALLRFLYHARDRVVDRRDLLYQVWGYNTSVTTHTLEAHVYRLRQKIELDPSEPRLLVTHRHGYRLTLDGSGARIGETSPPLRTAGRAWETLQPNRPILGQACPAD
jgi:DNA-binding response OmpR family regulator